MDSLQTKPRSQFQHLTPSLAQVWSRTLSMVGALLTTLETPLSHLQDGSPVVVDIHREATAEDLERNFIETGL
jgi:hypothetical protein